MLLSELFDPTPSPETSIACDLSVLDDPETHRDRFESLFEQREEIRKASGGLAIRFPSSMALAERILDFIRRERQCCPFLTFEVAFEPEERGIWLYMGGTERVENYITQEFNDAWL